MNNIGWVWLSISSLFEAISSSKYLKKKKNLVNNQNGTVLRFLLNISLSEDCFISIITYSCNFWYFKIVKKKEWIHEDQRFLTPLPIFSICIANMLINWYFLYREREKDKHYIVQRGLNVQMTLLLRCIMLSHICPPH